MWWPLLLVGYSAIPQQCNRCIYVVAAFLPQETYLQITLTRDLQQFGRDKFTPYDKLPLPALTRYLLQFRICWSFLTMWAINGPIGLITSHKSLPVNIHHCLILTLKQVHQEALWYQRLCQICRGDGNLRGRQRGGRNFKEKTSHLKNFINTTFETSKKFNQKVLVSRNVYVCSQYNVLTSKVITSERHARTNRLGIPQS